MIFSSTDGRVTVTTDINMLAEGLSLDHLRHRDLSKSIKICVDGTGDIHFIQFVTRIVPDMYTLQESNGEIQQWDSSLREMLPHYMVLDNHPAWKVDVPDEIASGSECYYDTHGVHKRNQMETTMYDCPGGAYMPEEERAIFCTFVLIDEAIAYKIQWSMQFNLEGSSFYSIQISNCNRLPDWAIRTITEDFNNTNNKVFSLPETLQILQQPDATREQLNEMAAADFLTAPENWLARKEFPNLFPAVMNTLQP